LRKVLDEQRYELIKSGLSDPLAELEKLNERGDKIDAALALRRLDTADYFRALSEAQEIPPPSRPSLLMPPEDTEALRKYAEIEENEADAGADDDSSISLDYYIEQALKTAGRDKELAALRRVRVEEANDAATATAAAAAPERAPASPEVLSAAAIAVAPDERQSVREMASDAAPLWRKAKPRSSVPIEAGGIVWRSELAPPDLVVAGMERAFRNAFRGMGAVRFIQEPPPGATASAFAAAFARFKAKGLVVDARALPAKADVTDLLRALRPAVLAALEEEPPSSLRILAKRVARFDEDGAMDAAPLGALLRGFDREEPDPEIVESPAGAARLARALAALGRRKRPLVLTLRGAESMGPTAHAVIIELAKISPALPVCGFIFFKPEKVESWHVLSQLTSPKAEPKVKPRQGRRDKSR
jgi:hypothetical protein